MKIGFQNMDKFDFLLYYEGGLYGIFSTIVPEMNNFINFNL